MTIELYLIRHTTPAIEAGVCYGQADVGLAETFEAEAAAVDAMLPRGLLFHSSPLSRCSRLAGALGSAPPVLDPRLMELSFGEWELKRWSEIDRDASDRWSSDYLDAAPPGGETGRRLIARCAEYLAEVCSAGPRSLGIVTHGGCIRAMAVHLLGLPASRLFSFGAEYGSVSKVELRDGEAGIVFWNRVGSRCPEGSTPLAR